MRAEAPYKAAKVMDYGIKKGFVKDDEKNLKMLAQGWHGTRIRNCRTNL